MSNIAEFVVEWLMNPCGLPYSSFIRAYTPEEIKVVDAIVDRIEAEGMLTWGTKDYRPGSSYSYAELMAVANGV